MCYTSMNVCLFHGYITYNSIPFSSAQENILDASHQEYGYYGDILKFISIYRGS